MSRKSLVAGVVCVLAMVSGSRGVAAVGPSVRGGPTTATAGQLIISEFRLDGPNGVNDEFIEIYNASGASHTVAAASGTGYGVAASDGVTRCTIPNGLVIPNHGHFLCTNTGTGGYSLGSYPAGSGTTATGDATYTTDIPDNVGIALFNNNSGGSSYSLANRLDAVGSTSEGNTIYKEGAGYPPILAPNLNGSLERKTVGMCPDALCSTGGFETPVYTSALVDTGDNASDFIFLDTNGTSAGFGQRLGAPGPENTSSPIMVDGSSQLLSLKASGCSARDAAPNRVRDLTSDPVNNSSDGTLDLRTNWRNTSPSPLTRLRFRIVDLTTWPAPTGFADLRPRTSPNVTITSDSYPCGTGTFSLVVQGTTLEQPPSQPNGSGFNGSLSVPGVSASTPLASGTAITVRFLIGIEQIGSARFCVIPETVPAVAGDPFCYIGSTEFTLTPAAGDFDYDQRADMPAYNPVTGQWTILKSLGGFTSALLINWGGPGYTAVPGDYDGDGKFDPAVYREATGVWSILTSSSNFTRATNFTLGGPGMAPVPGDYDGDGMTDPSVTIVADHEWIFAASSSNYTVAGGALFDDPSYTPVPNVDFDGDHHADLVLYQENTGLWLITTSGSGFSNLVTKAWGGHGYTVVAGDYDGDGRVDFGVYNRMTGLWSILKSSSGYTTVLSVSWGGPGFEPVPADYDGDHKTDIAVYQPSTLKWMVLKSTTSYSTVLTVTGSSAADVPLSTAVVPVSTREYHGGDADGDFVNDLTVYNTTSGIWSTLKSTSGYTTATNRGWGGTGYVPVPGDYDGDGKADLAVYQTSTGQWLVLRSSGGFTSTYSFSAGGPGYVPMPADYDGDGRTDMVVYNTTTGLWYGLKSSSGFTTSISIGWGGTGYTAAPGDFDADGKADLALYQASTGNWLILKSSSGYTTTIMRNFGGAGYVPVQADYDGDGITDFAVYQSSTGVWTVLNSSTGNASGFTVSYGGGAYVPVSGDYDRDGRADVGVYNPATGDWSILLSNGNYTTSFNKNWGGPGYTPITAFQ